VFVLDDDRLNEWWGEIERIISGPEIWLREPSGTPPEPHCAWYCPIHFFGHAWGIYIRESCILSSTIEIATFVNWRTVPNPIERRRAIAQQLLRSAFYVFYLHEQLASTCQTMGTISGSHSQSQSEFLALLPLS
jgi:hypothetical protein